MDQRQALLLVRACDAIAAYYTAELEGTQKALMAFRPALAEGAEAFSYFAASVAGMAARSGIMSPDEFMYLLPEQRIPLLPKSAFDWDAAVSVARLVANGEPTAKVRAQGAKMDVPTAITSCFSVALSAILVLSTLTNRSPTELVSILRDGATADSSQ